MSNYLVTVPLVGYTYCEVEAENEEDAKEKALDICCDFDNENVEVGEFYGVEHVNKGNVCYHPMWDMEVKNE